MNKQNKKISDLDNLKKKRNYNPWKWAFVLLLLFNLFIGVYWLSTTLNSEEVLEPTDTALRSDALTDQPYVFTVQVSSAELTRIMNDYLESISQGEQNLSVSVDEYISIEGTVDFLGFAIPYQMDFNPHALENGNLRLDIADFQVSGASIPVTLVMNIINHQLDWPEWIVIDTQEESILIRFDQLIIEDKFQVLVKKVDLLNDDIQLEVLVDNVNLFNSFDNYQN